MDALTKRLSTRFLVVTAAPNILFIAYIGFLLAAGAPARVPSMPNATKALGALTIRQIIVVLVVVLIISVAIHPLQTPLIQLVEGYWQGLPLGRVIAGRCVRRFLREFRQVEREFNKARERTGSEDWATEQSSSEARYRREWLPPGEEYLRPTVLGNTLVAGEIRAGDRYGLTLDVAMSRFIPLLPARTLADLRDRRNQLDAAVRLCVAAGLATAVGLGLLFWHEHWLYLPFATYLMCWLCYRSAIAAARGFSDALAAAIDLHHLRLFDALQLERPPTLADEWELNAKLELLFSNDISADVAAGLRYIVAKADQPPGE